MDQRMTGIYGQVQRRRVFSALTLSVPLSLFPFLPKTRGMQRCAFTTQSEFPSSWLPYVNHTVPFIPWAPQWKRKVKKGIAHQLDGPPPPAFGVGEARTETILSLQNGHSREFSRSCRLKNH